MTEQFGGAYEAYQKRVPMFFPRWGTWREFVNTTRLLLGRKSQQEQTLP